MTQFDKFEEYLNATYPDTTSPNDMQLPFVSVGGLSLYPLNNSASRSVMSSTQASQSLVTHRCDRKLITTGLDKQFAPYSAKTKMPHDGYIVAILPKFKKSPVAGSEDDNPLTLVFYKRQDNNELDYFELKNFGSFDQLFGWNYVHIDGTINKLHVGAYIPKDTVFSETPTTKNGHYDFGFNANVLLDSSSEVAEDGFMVCEEFLDTIKFDVQETRTIEFGTNKYPLNIHKSGIFPNIGEKIGKDGLLMALREYDIDTLAVDMSESGLATVDYLSDELVYVRSGLEGTVTDIKVYRNTSISFMPEQLCEQAQKYYTSNLMFEKEIVNLYNRLNSEHKKRFGPLSDLPISKKCQPIMVRAIGLTRQEAEDRGQVQIIHRKERIDAWRVEITVSYTIRPGKDFKLSDLSGGKGVIVKTVPRANMPRDRDGNVADVVLCGSSRFARMIPGSLYELYLTGVQRDIVRHHIKPAVRWVEGMTEDTFNAVTPDEVIHEAYKIYLEYLFLSSKTQFNIRKKYDIQKQRDVLHSVCEKGSIYLLSPIGDPIDLSKTAMLIYNRFKPTMGYVEYIHQETGQLVTMQDDTSDGSVPSIQIGVLYMMLLDKFGEEWMATSTSKMHLFGVAAPANKQSRYTTPYRETPPRQGETENRLYAANCGPYVTAELQSRANSVQTQKTLVNNIVKSDAPFSIVELVDREAVPYGDIKALEVTRHMMQGLGIEIAWQPDEEVFK